MIICAYTLDRWTIMREAIASVRMQTRAPDQILVVVDHNSALAERLRTAEYGIEVLESDDTQGLSGARNFGVRASTGSIIAFLDDDAVAQPDWIEQLLTNYCTPAVAGVGGHISPRWDGTRPRFFPSEFGWVVGCTYRGMPDETHAVRNLIGANMSFRREVFDTSGYFNSDLGRVGTLPLGCEETELCIRHSSIDHAAIFIHEPKARVDHLVTKDRQGQKYFYRRCFSEGLSKAAVVSKSGAQRGLSSEVSHATKTLPRGVATGLTDTLRTRTLDGVAQSTAIVLGLGTTGAGYLVGTVRHAVARRKNQKESLR